MLIEEILALGFEKAFTELTKVKTGDPVLTIDKYNAQYANTHEVLKRVDKIIDSKVVTVAKLAIPFQKKIVKTATAFTIGKGIHLSASEEMAEGLARIKAEWDGMKMDKHTKELLKALMIETRVAELFYIQTYVAGPNDPPLDANNPDPTKLPLRIKSRLLTKKKGYDLWPHYDDYGDMDAFVVKYIVNFEGKDVEQVDIYTAKEKVTNIKSDPVQELTEANPFGKIPVVFYNQEETEWQDVQTLIDRIEDMLSKNADANDYFGSPAVKVKGKIKKMPDKGEVGKLFQIEAESINGVSSYGDIEYLTWDRTPESIKMEYETLKDIIYTMTFTPDLSFNNVKGMGAVTGIVLKFMFMDAMLKAENKRELLSEGLERRINIWRAMIGTTTDIRFKPAMDILRVEFSYTDSTPQNDQELIDLLMSANGSKQIMSQRTSISKNPMIEDTDAELALIEEEKKAAMDLMTAGMGESFNAPASE